MAYYLEVPVERWIFTPTNYLDKGMGIVFRLFIIIV